MAPQVYDGDQMTERSMDETSQSKCTIDWISLD